MPGADEPDVGPESLPDPNMQVVSLTSMSLGLHQAHILAGKLNAHGIRAVVAPGGTGFNHWVGVPVVGPEMGPRAEVLVERHHLEEARRLTEKALLPVPGSQPLSRGVGRSTWIKIAMGIAIAVVILWILGQV